MRGGAVIDFQSLRGGAVPVELFGADEAGSAEAVSSGAVGGECFKLLRHGLNIGRVDHGGGIAHNLAERTAGGGNHRATTGHRFHGRKTEPFVERRIYENARSAIEIGELIIWHKAK